MASGVIKEYKKGAIIFLEGDPGDCAYIIEQGRVGVFVHNKGEKVPLTNLGVGEIFGEMAVIDGSARSASVEALEDCQLIVVSSDQIFERIEESDPIVRLLISVLLKHIRNRNQKNAPKTISNAPITKGRVASIEPEEMQRQSHAAVLGKMKLESELYEALQEKHFLLHYQPIMNLETMQVAGFEALIRWKSESRGMVRPDIFMGIAEETSLIVPIGKWVIEQAVEDRAKMAKLLKSKGLSVQKLFMSINISGRQFGDAAFFEKLTQPVRKYKVDPRVIKLEVTERVFMEGMGAIHAIHKARELGFPVALDDFGTGYSSLSYLHQFDIDSLKVDQSFVRMMRQDNKSLVITEAVVNLAKGLGVPVIAEGIEEKEDLKILKDMGCTYGQGYLFSKPLPYDEALKFMLKSKTPLSDAG